MNTFIHTTDSLNVFWVLLVSYQFSWYNRTGWLGIKYQVTYLLPYSEFNRNVYFPWLSGVWPRVLSVFLTFPLFPDLHMPCDPFPQTGREQTVQTDVAAYPEAVTSLSLWQLALASHRLSPQSTTVHWSHLLTKQDSSIRDCIPSTVTPKYHWSHLLTKQDC